ncbi:uncharacterized protein [Phaseolus vulgaris]|uniref:uncharacterized protein n=1 Tax=Phaseolus vulgaris TaxID=3885 RepID=UPI0035CA0152
MEEWEGLDIDTTDIASFIRKCNSNTNVIPGPAGNVQAVILNRNSEGPVNTQEFINRIGDESDRRDFTSNPWRWAEQFLQFHGVIDGHDCGQLSYLSEIKQSNVLPLLTCVIKSCHRNVIGGMSISLKDRKGIASASVHQKVLIDAEFGADIVVGSVKIFSPDQRVFYLQITVNNIVKVFKFDICPPTEELIRASKPVIRVPPILDAKYLRFFNEEENRKNRS